VLFTPRHSEWSQLLQTHVLFSSSNLSHVTSKIHISAKFLVDLKTTLNTKFVGMCVVYLHITICMPNSDDSLAVAVKPKAKYKFRATAILSYNLQT
jgi:hypothetical protein